MEKPVVQIKYLESGSIMIRLKNLEDSYYYDDVKNNTQGLGHKVISVSSYKLENYLSERHILTQEKYDIIEEVRKELIIDKSFLELTYKSKSEKRKNILNKFSGNLSIVDYSKGSDKMFHKLNRGAKKQTLNIAIQVGVFANQNYLESFKKIIKLILSCQALNVSLNIDLFDSDTKAIKGKYAYSIINLAKSDEKLDLKKIMVASHSLFFRYTLFNCYSAAESEKLGFIETFVNQDRIIHDLGPYYDIIGGNILNETLDSKIIKIAQI